MPRNLKICIITSVENVYLFKDVNFKSIGKLSTVLSLKPWQTKKIEEKKKYYKIGCSGSFY